nr:putative bacterial blight-resistance protein Xa1 [Oryza sativa Indica Group]
MEKAVAVAGGTGVDDDDRAAALQLWASTVGLGGEVQLLTAARRRIGSVLSEAEGKEIQNKALELCLREASHHAARSDDLLGELEYYRIRGEVEVDELDELQDDDDMIVPHITGTMIQVTNTRLVPHLEITEKDNMSCEISEHVKQCCRMTNDIGMALELEKLDRHILQVSQNSRTNVREMSYFSTEPKVHGRNAERDLIISKLTSEESNMQNLSVLAIVGNGGVGKTAVARMVYKDPAVSEHFDMVLWLYVSVYFNEVKIARELLELLHGDRHETVTDFDELLNILGYEMKLKRVLLVMDDMWEDSKKEKWDEFLTPLITNGAKGNKIIVTTRKSSVARMTGATYDINLDGLEPEDFWGLFKECAFGDENYQGHRKLQRIGREIAVKLKGYPLAAKSVGKLLKRKLDDEHWTRILDNTEWKNQKDDNDIIPALKISYNYLPKHLQQCFSYCSIFPKNHRYDEKRLVHIWIAQGFVPFTDQCTRAEEIGSKYLADLIDWGFFLSEPPRSSLLMHDLVHDLAQIVSSHESFTIEDFKPAGDFQLIRHVSIITESAYYGQFDGTVEPNENFMQEFAKTFCTLPQKNLSTLMLFGAHDLSFAGTFHHQFNEVRAVRVVKMEVVYPDLNILLPNISGFINLRYLELSSFYRGLKLQLPEAICKLYQLHVLDISSFNATTILPKGLNKLVNLRHFMAREELHAQIASVGRLIFLQELMAFDVRKESEFCIAQLENLNEIRGSISIYNLQNLESQEEARKARLLSKLQLTSLRLSWFDMQKSSSSLNIIEGLEPPTCIKKLQIEGYNGSAPSWLSSSFCLTSLQSLHLEKCKYWSALPPLQQLPELQELHLINMSHITSIPIGRLKVLELRNMPRLRRFVESERDQPYKNLEVVELQECHHLKDLPFQLNTSGTLTEHLFPRLQRVQIRDCHGYSNLPPFPLVDTLTDIDIWNAYSDYMLFRLSVTDGSRLCLEMEGDKSNSLQAIDETILKLSKLKDLQELEIRCYPCVKYLAWEELRKMTSLKKFKVEDCTILFSNSPNLCLPSSVKEMEFARCDITGKQLSELMLNLPLLQILKVHYCKNITSLAVGMFADEQYCSTEEGLWHIPPSGLMTLEKLEISFSDILFRTKDGLGGFSSLKELDTRRCPMLLSSMVSEAESVVSNCCSLLPPSILKLDIGDMVDRLLPQSKLSSLAELHIFRSPLLEYLDVRSCTALQQLHIEDCYMLQSIEGLQIPSSLAKLKIVSCSKLGSLQLDFCKSLKTLIVERCDSLCTLDGSHSLASVKEVSIYKNPVLASVELHSCHALEKLSIRDCPALASWKGFRSLTSIMSLEVSKSPGFVPSWQSAAEQIKEEGHEFTMPLKLLDIDDNEFLSMPICRQLTSLQDLTIRGVLGTPSDRVDILTDNHKAALLLLASLERLTLSGFEHLESLPSEIRHFPLLKTLKILYCPRITSLPDEGMPSSLEEMDIYRCSSELTELCRSMSENKTFRIYNNANFEL